MRRRGRDSGKRARTRHIMRWRSTCATISVTAAQLDEAPDLSMRNILMQECKRFQAERLAMEEQRFFDVRRVAYGLSLRPTSIAVGDLP